ncbi:hypothetical protein BN1013_02193 [Candidatus Rubidus massiliensis]|nr:hypothetical protein BN1013_02193 [Candidatus Rubidus massiliensis]
MSTNSVTTFIDPILHENLPQKGFSAITSKG